MTLYVTSMLAIYVAVSRPSDDVDELSGFKRNRKLKAPFAIFESQQQEANVLARDEDAPVPVQVHESEPLKPVKSVRRRPFKLEPPFYLHTVWQENSTAFHFPSWNASSPRDVTQEDDACATEQLDASFIRVGIDMFVYSVFSDSRRNDFDNPDAGTWLRIMSVIHKDVASALTPLYCIFSDGAVVRAVYYETCENHKRRFGGFVLSCRVPDVLQQTRICLVRLSPTSSPDHRLAADFDVISTKPAKHQHDFTVCVAPLYGDVTTHYVTQFVELTSMLGATHVNFYNYNLKNALTRSLLAALASQGRVSLRQWNLPAAVDAYIWYHGQAIANMDCLYRGMASSKHVVYLDLDEVLVPYAWPTWHEMIGDLNEERRACAFCFDSVFVDPDTQTGVNLTMGGLEGAGAELSHVWRTSGCSHFRRKCVIKPQQVFEVGIHHVSKPTFGSFNVTSASFPRVLVHHFRQCQPNFRMDCVNMVRDDVIASRFAAEVLSRVNRTLASLNAA